MVVMMEFNLNHTYFSQILLQGAGTLHIYKNAYIS